MHHQKVTRHLIHLQNKTNKAFDKVNHSRLHIKLMKRNIPVELLGLLENGCRIVLHVLSGIAVGRLYSKSLRALGRDRFCHRIFSQCM